ncbi:MAG: NAD(P)/FAD-dependent oxidoreductase [Muribaculum sp.]|nr:NAD(P)/FAD-dependent oxidoreductase [Muribaculum sp.]
MTKGIIIGGGIAGLSAGIYALQHGISVELYEKNAMVGGECTGWDRQGYHIDNCIHWLTGCRPEDDLYRIWRNLGVIDDTVPIYREPYFYSMERGGRTLHFWRDLERGRREFLAAAPEDAEQINRFFDSVQCAECVKVPCEKSMAQMNPIESMRFAMGMASMGRVLKEYGEDTVADLAGRFTNPHVREMMGCYMNASYKAVALLSSYAFYTSGTAGIPMGGSVGMVRRMAARFEKLGGSIHTGMPAERILLRGGRAQAVLLADGSRVDCDAVICAVDPTVTFGGLLDVKYRDRKLTKMYETPDGYRTASGFQAAFGIAGDAPCGTAGGSVVFPCAPFSVAGKEIGCLGMRTYDYDPELFPADRRVIQCNILQDGADYAFWRECYADRARYQAEKERIAEDVRQRIVERYPLLEHRLIFLGAYSPMTFTKWCGAYQGSYMSFFEQKGYKSLAADNRVKGLKNVFLASQWLTTNGGLPIAATSGKFAAECLARSLG